MLLDESSNSIIKVEEKQSAKSQLQITNSTNRNQQKVHWTFWLICYGKKSAPDYSDADFPLENPSNMSTLSNDSNFLRLIVRVRYFGLPACVDLCLSAPSPCAPESRAARAQQREPGRQMAAVAGMGNVLRQVMLRGKGHGAQRRFGLTVRVGEQLAAAIAGAAVIFDVAVFCAGRSLGGHLLEAMAQRGNR